MNSQYTIIMAGGVGSRFWPMSRNHHPKQFIDILHTGKTLLQQTYERVCLHTHKENIYVVTNAQYAELVKTQLPELNKYQILCEPFGRNTAPCIAYGLFKIVKKDPQANIVICPADHLITNEKMYQNMVSEALYIAQEQSVILTMGVTPTHPNTGYGYIQYIKQQALSQSFKVKTFTEKPNAEIAQMFVDSGDFLWNSGIFIGMAQTWLAAYKQHLNDIYVGFEQITNKLGTQLEAEVIKEVYEQCLNISIDNGIMEKIENVYVIPVNFGWSDLGTWNSLYEQLDKTTEGNVLRGKVFAYNTHNTLVSTNKKNKLVVLEGLKDMLVIEYDNALLICPRDSEQKIKQFVNDLKNANKEDFI